MTWGHVSMQQAQRPHRFFIERIVSVICALSAPRRSWTRDRRGAAALVLLLIAAAAPAYAVDLRDVLADYTLTSWSRKDGLTGPVWAFAQDADGFLWLGNDDGLVRFDGVRFVAWNSVAPGALPQAPVRALRVALDGAIWIGLGGSDGGVARIADRNARVFRTRDDPAAPAGTITALVEDRAHAIWAAGNGGLYRFAGDRWQKFGLREGLPDATITNTYVDSSGTLWVGTSIGLFARRETSEDRFQQIESSPEPLRGRSLSEDPTGRIWASDPLVGFRAVGDRPAPPGPTESGRGYRLLHDRAGNLWVATIGQGLWRVRSTPGADRPTIERTTVLSGLSSDAVRSVFEDRDGNIWAGTTEGVDRLAPHRVTPWTGLGIVSTIAVTPDDRILVGTAEGLLRFTRTTGSWQPDAARIPLVGIRAVRAATGGRVWALSADGWVRVAGARVTRVPLPPRAAAIEAIAADANGGMLAVAHDGTIYRDSGTTVEAAARVPELDNVRITTAFGDRDGRLWVAFSGSRVGVLRGSTFTAYRAQEGLGSGQHYAFHQDQSGGIWVAGTDGLSRFENSRFALVGRSNGLPPGGVFALAEDSEQTLWLATSAGLLRVPQSEFDSAFGAPQYQIHYRGYDPSDGLAGFPAALGDSQAVRAGDGTLWFVTSRGMSVVQPSALAAARPAPHVSVDRVEADDRVVAAGPLARLPPGTSKLLIDYTAPDLTSPLKLRFRYRLDPFDADWIDGGTRRQAFYTNLPSRKYRFHVAVSGDDGRWAEREGSLDFSIAPRFYQTWWFYLLAAAAGAAAVYGAWQWRLRQLRGQFALVLGERVRVSRELHDTLLQSLVGVALEVDSIAKSLDASPAVAKQRIVEMRERVEEYIRDARRSIWSLRSPALETRDLVEALRESGERAAAGQPVRFEFDLTGTPRRYGGNVEHQLLRIGQEAVLNAVRHARAHQVKMTLQYSNDGGVALRVADDGTGFAPDAVSEGTTDHYGITTMKERAQQVGGRVTISSRPDAGTVIEAIVPAADAAGEQ